MANSFRTVKIKQSYYRFKYEQFHASEINVFSDRILTFLFGSVIFKQVSVLRS